jgi:hypothetical protein
MDLASFDELPAQPNSPEFGFLAMFSKSVDFSYVPIGYLFFQLC